MFHKHCNFCIKMNKAEKACLFKKFQKVILVETQMDSETIQ